MPLEFFNEVYCLAMLSIFDVIIPILNYSLCFSGSQQSFFQLWCNVEKPHKLINL